MSHALPAPLAGWSPALSGLAPGLAVALGPLVRGLDELVRRGDPASAWTGEADGYGGLSRRGDPDRILLSEWAVALELPTEFLRRAAGRELLHVEPAYRQERPRGRVAALVDSGPAVFGAGRLVQLAALVVLHRRAAERGTDLLLGILGEQPGNWRGGGVRDVLGGWLSARRTPDPEPADVADWTGVLDRADEAWVLAGPELAAALPGRRRTIVATESAWDAAGAVAVRVAVGDRHAELALPRGSAATRALRSASSRPQRLDSVQGVRHLSFTSAQPTLLGRGSRPEEIVRIGVPAPGAQPPRPKRHTFPGPVLTAAALGRRLVALVARGDEITVEVIGKHLGRTDGITTAAGAAGLGRDDLAALADGPLAPLCYTDEGLLVRLGPGWYRMDPDRPLRSAPGVLGIHPRDPVDQPAVAQRHAGQVWVSYIGVLPAGDTVVLGPGRLAAWPEAPDRWRVRPGDVSIEVGPGESVRALHLVDGVPALVTVSAGGVLARLRRPGETRTLTAWSGGLEPPVVHPTRPWIAVRDKDGAVLVGDLTTGAVLLRLAGTP